MGSKEASQSTDSDWEEEKVKKMDSASAAGSINPAGQSSDCRTDVRSEQQNQSRRLLSADTHSSLPFIPAGLTNKPPVSAGHHVDTHTQTHAHTHTNTRA